MNSAHDLGGMQGFGPVQPEAHEPLFHAEWERQALGLTLAMGATGAWNLDAMRHARESLPPAFYLSASYYEIWLAGLRRMLIARGLVSPAEWDSGVSQSPGVALPRRLMASQVDAALAKGTSAQRPVRQSAHFAVGQRVRARNQHPMGHTRLPRYVRGHVGTVVRVHGVHVLPDRHAALTATPDSNEGEWLYAVVFDGRDLWGPDAQARLEVCVDAWESYLEPWEARP